MQTPSLGNFQNEVTFIYRKKRALGNLLWGIFVLLVSVTAIIQTEKYYYGVFILLGISSLWNYLAPGTDKLIIKAGFAWPWSLYDKTKPENKILKVETNDIETVINTVKTNYRIDHMDLSLEDLSRLDLLKKWLEEQSDEERK